MDNKKLTKLNEKALLNDSENSFRLAIIRKVNRLVTEVNQGVIHENKVKAERDVNQVYDDLPLSVVAEMVEEEYNTVMSELGLNEEE